MTFLSIIIPAYNEQQRLPQTLEKLISFFSHDSEVALREIIIIDDGSTDETVSVAKTFPSQIPFIVISLEKNSGKGAAVRKGIEQASGDHILIYDADGATPPEEMLKLVRHLQSQSADVVIGSRVLGEGDIVRMQWYRRLTGKIFHLLCAPLLPGIADASCGCKLFTRKSAKKIFSLQTIDRFAFDIEILMIAMSLGYKVEEVSVRWHAVPDSKVHLAKDGIEMIWQIAKLYVRGVSSDT